MTVEQANKLALYTRKLNYRCEIHYVERDGAPRWSNRGIVLRCRRGTERWSWVWHHRDWPLVMRGFRSLDRAGDAVGDTA